MKRETTSPLALALSVLIALVTLPPVTHAQSRVQRTADTWIVTLGANQILRISVVAGDVNSDGFVGKGGATAFRFGKATYMPLVCTGQGVCKYTIDSQSLSAPVTLNPGEVATFDVSGGGNPVRAVVLSNDANLRVNALIVDLTTGNTVSLIGLGSYIVNDKAN